MADTEAHAGDSAKATTGRRTRNRRGEGERLRQELLDAALGILREEGGESALSLRAVARRAGVTAPAVYLHFPSKEAVVEAVLRDRFQARAAASYAAAGAAHSDAEALRAGCLAYLDFAEQDPGAYRLLFEGGVSHPRPEGAPPEQPLGRNAFETLLRGLRVCQANGTIPTGDVERSATLVWTGLHGIATLRRAHPDFPWPALADLVADLLTRLTGLPDEG
jgi:AcrR family transcriptional regulator